MARENFGVQTEIVHFSRLVISIIQANRLAPFFQSPLEGICCLKQCPRGISVVWFSIVSRSLHEPSRFESRLERKSG